jgi:hypothetical protein
MHSTPVKFLILIDAAETRVARLFDAEHGHVMDMDASTEDVVATIDGVAPSLGATASEWDRALAGHSAAERAQAQVFTLAV